MSAPGNGSVPQLRPLRTATNPCGLCLLLQEPRMQRVRHDFVPTSREMPRIVPSHFDELKHHFDASVQRLVDDVLRQLRPTHEQLLKVVEESRAEMAALTATVTEMRDTIKSLTAENGGLRNELLQDGGREYPRRDHTAAPPPATPAPLSCAGLPAQNYSPLSSSLDDVLHWVDRP